MYHAGVQYSETNAIQRMHFRLLDLPIELQLYIFELAVTKPRDIDKIESQPALSCVSKSIREDVLKAYYKNNTFKYCYGSGSSKSCLDSLAQWLESMGPARRAWLRKLYVFDIYDGWAEFEKQSRESIQDMEAVLRRFAGRWKKVGGIERRVTFASEDVE